MMSQRAQRRSGVLPAVSCRVARLSVALLLGACRSRPDSHAETRDAETEIRDPTVAVIVHSWTGRTATAGHEIAEMLGGRFVRVGDSPDPARFPSQGPTLEEVTPGLRLDGVRRLFLGFPIYDETPSRVAHALVEQLPLAGVRVTPLVTYLHFYRSEALEELSSDIRRRGGEPTLPIVLRLPTSVSDEDIVQRARAALLARRDLWLEVSGQQPVACTDLPLPHAARVCTVPAGEVWMGDVATPPLFPGSPPPRRETVAAFDLDEKEVTVAQYRRCIEAGRCRDVIRPGIAAALVRSSADLPMLDLSLSDARAYCQFVGLRLPTEAEWTRAARGDGLRTYPWGDEPPGAWPLRANLGDAPDAGLARYALAASDAGWPDDGVAGLARGCTFPAGRGPFGHCDLVGNMAEWVEGVHGSQPSLKGGCWLDVEVQYASIAARLSAAGPGVSMGSYVSGTRCARSR